jgi:RsiW-degrading membrane proteinase PrsW (M82 family)
MLVLGAVRVIRPGVIKVNSRSKLSAIDPIFGIAPAVVWPVILAVWRPHWAGSLRTLLMVMLTGALSTGPALFLEHSTGAALSQPTLDRSVAVSFLLIAPIEEIFKLSAVWVCVYRTYAFDQPALGVVYSTTAAVGFACVENVAYITQLGSDVLILRLVFATPAHILFSCQWGYALGIARFQKQGEAWTIIKGLFLAILLHGAYNSIAVMSLGFALVALVPLMVFMVWFGAKRIIETRSHQRYTRRRDEALVVCPVCEAHVSETETHCSRCGVRIPEPGVDAARLCARCGRPLEAGSDYCSRCGKRHSRAPHEHEPRRALSIAVL